MNKNKRQASVQRTVTMGNAVRQDGKERQVEIIDDEDDEIEEISKVFFFFEIIFTLGNACVFAYDFALHLDHGWRIWPSGKSNFVKSSNIGWYTPLTNGVRGSFYKLNTPFFALQFMARVWSTRAMKWWEDSFPHPLCDPLPPHNVVLSCQRFPWRYNSIPWECPVC